MGDDGGSQASPRAAASISSVVPQLRHTRTGGRCTNPQLRQRVPAKPNFHSSAARGGRRGGAVRLGAAGRLQLDQAVPREVGQVRHHDALGALNTDGRGLSTLGQAASVVRSSSASQPSNAETTRIVSSGSATSSTDASAMPASAAPENPIGEVRVDFDAFTSVPDPFGDRAVGARDDDVVGLCEAGFVEHRVDGGADQRCVAVRAEAFLPLLAGDRPG